MGFVKTAEEIERLRAVMQRPRFVSSKMLSVVFESDADTLAAVLPPGLELTEPTVRAMVGQWRSNCVGDFAGGALYLPARCGGVEGEYVLAMYMTTDAAIIFGRELFGEPKKQSEVLLDLGGARASGAIARGGVTLMALDAELGEELGPERTAGANFNIKATPSCTGAGLEDDAVLTVAEFDVHFTSRRTGTGTVELTSTAHDPLGDLPVRRVVEAIYQEGDLFPTTRRLGTIPADDFLPYAYGRMDDYSLLDTEPAVPAPA